MKDAQREKRSNVRYHEATTPLSEIQNDVIVGSGGKEQRSGGAEGNKTPETQNKTPETLNSTSRANEVTAKNLESVPPMKTEKLVSVGN